MWVQLCIWYMSSDGITFSLCPLQKRISTPLDWFDKSNVPFFRGSGTSLASVMVLEAPLSLAHILAYLMDLYSQVTEFDLCFHLQSREIYLYFCYCIIHYCYYSPKKWQKIPYQPYAFPHFFPMPKLFQPSIKQANIPVCNIQWLKKKIFYFKSNINFQTLPRKYLSPNQSSQVRRNQPWYLLLPFFGWWMDDDDPLLKKRVGEKKRPLIEIRPRWLPIALRST